MTSSVISPYLAPNFYADALSKGRHRDIVGGRWDETGRAQMAALRAEGLMPHHRLLDIGAGDGGVIGGAFDVPGSGGADMYGFADAGGGGGTGDPAACGGVRVAGGAAGDGVDTRVGACAPAGFMVAAGGYAGVLLVLVSSVGLVGRGTTKKGK